MTEQELRHLIDGFIGDCELRDLRSGAWDPPSQLDDEQYALLVLYMMQRDGKIRTRHLPAGSLSGANVAPGPKREATQLTEAQLAERQLRLDEAEAEIEGTLHQTSGDPDVSTF